MNPKVNSQYSLSAGMGACSANKIKLKKLGFTIEKRDVI